MKPLFIIFAFCFVAASASACSNLAGHYRKVLLSLWRLKILRQEPRSLCGPMSEISMTTLSRMVNLTSNFYRAR